MDCLGFQSLIGILGVRRRSQQLTPLSSDDRVSIPDRDLVISHHFPVSLRPITRLSHSIQELVIERRSLNGYDTLNLSAPLTGELGWG